MFQHHAVVFRPGIVKRLAVCLLLVVGLQVMWSTPARGQAGLAEDGSGGNSGGEVFDWRAILDEPVDFQVLETERMDDGIVFQKIEFTSRTVDGKAERVQGIYVFPETARARPAVFWSMGGMAPANRHFPGILARKGYPCLVITLPHAIRSTHRTPFDTQNPAIANLTLLARDQMRGITALSQQPEVDPDRIAVAGSSYGGFFATLIAGADPRIKAGFSFFAGGHHAMGTNLPHFQLMQSLDDVAVWNRTIDPAFRLKTREVPFMWGVAFNDNWFHFPAVGRTFIEAAGTGKRLAILPHWQHGFPPHIDQALLDFLDTTLGKTRPVYNAPSPIQFDLQENHVMASFTWDGDQPVTKAELVVSYGEDVPWLGWLHRAAFIFPAAVEGRRAVARLPIPARDLPLIVWGSITDENQVLTSTPPATPTEAERADWPLTPDLKLNAFVDGTFGDEVLAFYRMSGHTLAGVPDHQVKDSGHQSLRQQPSAQGAKPAKSFMIRLFHHVPGVAHRLAVSLRAEQPTTIRVQLTPIRPRSWQSEVVQKLLADEARVNPQLASRIRLLLSRASHPVEPIQIEAPVGPEWQVVELDVPLPVEPVDGYMLEIHELPEHRTPFWIDSLHMQPQWTSPGTP